MGLTDVTSTLDKTYSELETQKDKLVLEYALAKTSGKLGDIIDYVENGGKACAIVIESAYMIGDGVCIYGTRYLKSGSKGIIQDSVHLNKNNWKLRK